MTRFVVTAGHGVSSTKKDPGACYYGYTEAELMTELRDFVAHELREDGHQVDTDGSRAQNLALAVAVKLLGTKPRLGIELHTNASSNLKATGVEVVSLPQHKLVSQKLAQAIARALGIPVRGDAGWRAQQDTPHGRLAFVQSGGLIVETFFISNLGDLDAYRRRKLQVAIVIAEVLKNA